MTRTTTRTGTRSVSEELAPVVSRLLGHDLPIGLRAWDGSEAGPPDPPVTVIVHRPEALQHLLWAPGELGLARAYISGSLDVEGDIYALLGIRDLLAEPGDDFSIGFDPAGWVSLVQAVRRLGLVGPRPPLPAEESHLRGHRHSRRRDAAAISHHYDVGNDFYRLLLGARMTYSCAYWADGVHDLATAQDAKHELVCHKLGLQPGMRLLDVGCGWGSMAMHAARHHGAQVVGVTISEEQAERARERVAEAGLTDQVEIRVQDYRLVHDGPFDAISSIGMFEHVGIEMARTYFSHLHDLLRPGGRLLNHAISRPDPNPKAAAMAPRSFVGRYVFPDAALLEVGTVVSAMQGLGLEVRDVQSLREHYARTLRAWSANLDAGWDDAQRMVGPGRARVWRLYVAGSALGFEQARIAIHQVLAVRPHPDGHSDVAATRAEFEVDVNALAG
jgi:cyclopropane-fatty-acyl-phospholipid synthase